MGNMERLATIVLGFLFTLASGSEVTEEPKKVGCFYLGVESEKYGTLYPEDIDASICSYIMYPHGSIETENSTITLKAPNPKWKIEGDGLVPRLVKLKEKNPDLKLILNVHSFHLYTIVEPEERIIAINNLVQWLQEKGFDGIEFAFLIGPAYRNDYADFLCTMKPEFDKHGYQLSVTLMDRKYSEPSPGQEGVLNKLARCCDYITVLVDKKENETEMPGIDENKTNVNWFIERGVPAKKLKVAIPSSGTFVRREDDDETAKPIIAPNDILGAPAIRYREILNHLNDTSLEWTISRDKNTKKVYASTSTGFSVAFEDPESIALQASYILENGIGGMELLAIDMDDAEGVEGKGTFPLTRAIYNTFRPRN